MAACLGALGAVVALKQRSMPVVGKDRAPTSPVHSMGMRYRRPNRRRHKHYSPQTQATAALLGFGALFAPFTYGITLLAALLLVSCRFLRQ